MVISKKARPFFSGKHYPEKTAGKNTLAYSASLSVMTINILKL
jgi:hypothetical protein